MKPVKVNAAYLCRKERGRVERERVRESRAQEKEGVRCTYCVREIFDVGRWRSVREAAERKSFVTGGHGWMVKGPPLEARYEPSGIIAFNVGAAITKATTPAITPAAFFARAVISAFAAGSVSSLYSRQRRSWLHCATTLNMWEPERMKFFGDTSQPAQRLKRSEYASIASVIGSAITSGPFRAAS